MQVDESARSDTRVAHGKMGDANCRAGAKSPKMQALSGRRHNSLQAEFAYLPPHFTSTLDRLWIDSGSLWIDSDLQLNPHPRPAPPLVPLHLRLQLSLARCPRVSISRDAAYALQPGPPNWCATIPRRQSWPIALSLRCSVARSTLARYDKFLADADTRLDSSSVVGRPAPETCSL